MRILALILLVPSLAFSQGIKKQSKLTVNYCLQSNTITNGAGTYISPWAQNSGNVTGEISDGPGGGRWTEIKQVALNARPNQGVTIPASSTIVASVYIRKPVAGAPNGNASVIARCGAGTPPTCRCWRSDGGACATTSSGTDCVASVNDLPTTLYAIRLAAIATCSQTVATPTIMLMPGLLGVDNAGVAQYSGAQLSIGTGPPDPLVVTTTQARRSFFGPF
jgi:hypothetical protein